MAPCVHGRPARDRERQYSSIPYSTVGVAPQDLKYQGERPRTRDRKSQRIREFVTIHRGTEGGAWLTSIGDDNLLMAYVHVAHDVRVGTTVLAHAATLGGHVTVGDWAVVGALQRRSPVLPDRPPLDDRRLQRDHAGRAAVLDHGEPRGKEVFGANRRRSGTSRISSHEPSRLCRQACVLLTRCRARTLRRRSSGSGGGRSSRRKWTNCSNSSVLEAWICQVACRYGLIAGNGRFPSAGAGDRAERAGMKWSRSAFRRKPPTEIEPLAARSLTGFRSGS